MKTKEELMNYNTKYLEGINDFTRRYYKYLNLSDDLVQEAIVRFLTSYNDTAGSNPTSWYKACIDSVRNNYQSKNNAKRRISKNNIKSIEDDTERFEGGDSISYLKDEKVSEMEANEVKMERDEAIQLILELLPRVQRSVMKLLFQNYTAKQIAETLHIQRRYVSQYKADAIKNVKHKLSSRPELKTKIINKLF